MFYRIFPRFSYWKIQFRVAFTELNQFQWVSFDHKTTEEPFFNMIYLYINWIENFGAKSTNYCIENND